LFTLMMTPEEAQNLVAKLATPDAYSRAGLSYNPIVSSLRASLERQSNGNYVVADPNYESGQVDALEASSKLVKGYTFQLFVVILALTVAELWRGTMREQYPLMQSPLFALLIGFGFFIFNIFSNILLFRVYQLRLKEQPI